MTRLNTLTRTMTAIDEAELLLQGQLATIAELRDQLAKQTTSDAAAMSEGDIEKARRFMLLTTIGAHDVSKAALIALLLDPDE